ncbi:hypothetical protein PLICRDRAFT_46203 [Plicaturopsis crispa FD-325 SS-3]|uniref:Uncharacterized protein n=1 Tax=Plicaturopsis crispa FD-325 SS-3 TaxID=944288 RepID=A0A0C9SXE9_PLICR|nr:hypothetical protein PLICRDRAFT_46203 [Plicaturopsis crispa FD-325 SS-3]
MLLPFLLAVQVLTPIPDPHHLPTTSTNMQSHSEQSGWDPSSIDATGMSHRYSHAVLTGACNGF